jgi:type IV pilus assembly protein PilW
LAAGDVVLVSDCSGAEAIQISSIAGNVITLQNAPSRSYVNGEVYPINTISYYVRSTPVKTNRTAITATDLISLYRRIDSNDAQELIEGIEDMQILYGEDTDADSTANYYVSADNVTNMAQVVSIRITLTARTFDGNLTSTGDGRLRRNFTSTIAIRNRL